MSLAATCNNVLRSLSDVRYASAASSTCVCTSVMAAVISSAICAICGAQNLLPAQRYRLWDEEARPTELCRKLKAVVGEENVDGTQMKSKFSCRPCRSSVLSVVRLKEQFDKWQTELLAKMLKNRRTCPSPRRRLPIPPEKRPRTCPSLRRRLPIPPGKRPRGSPSTRTGVSPLTKRYLPDAALRPTTPPRGSLAVAREPKTDLVQQLTPMYPDPHKLFLAQCHVSFSPRLLFPRPHLHQ